MKKEIDYKEAQDFEKSAFVVSLEEFIKLERDYRDVLKLAFASDMIPSEKILKENKELKETLNYAYNFTDLCIEEMYFNGSYEKRLELQEKLHKLRN